MAGTGTTATSTEPGLAGSYVVAVQRDDPMLVRCPDEPDELGGPFGQRALSEAEMLSSRGLLHAARKWVRGLGLMIGACTLLAWVASAALAQGSSAPKATVSIGLQTVAAEPWSDCISIPIDRRGYQPGPCPFSFSDLMATGEPAIIRFDRPIALTPTASLRNRDARQPSSGRAVTAVQRDELTYEVVLPTVTEPSFLIFTGHWIGTRVGGDARYVVGLLPVPVDSALEIRKVKWTGARLRVSGRVHPYASAVTLRFACNGTAITKILPTKTGKWRTTLRAPSACATTSDGRLVVRVSSTDRLRAGKVSMRIAHRIGRR